MESSGQSIEQMVVKRVNKQSIAIKKHHPGNRTVLFIIIQTEN
ncbi:TPA: hypothetical protein ACXPX3_000449 [Klebsiella variicola subsp. variicola]|uniref:Uncharacterized protein n=1 Tax=Klebsiella variicola (strain 342) TaxID=507522 RepID=B5XX26_KLEV3|nr:MULTISPECIES: hypothetical protein [Klebsiella]HBQ5895548.1 hypothetical protein [Klebsiella variicola subsp. variicola]ACI10269.1 hypothetical protein KPK_2510 [Klebsiella variicola]MBR7601330.1 hypothetical protein [Klebsiella variicola]MEB6353896.1 hypothetical protein [Klebsiella variicola]HBZ7346687.1 hypothetical protein [Klebsiella variicola subsp. variicola]